ncbi:aminotransferase class III-fold pyridoxal phosphate-dependent enzyme [Pseudomonas sp. RHF3.3-3]|uniref:aminotransferase class III-fold pyridoxal phosphate-dependent enzyme n=1 Tax=Pseudomonas sp. RHF3.3-3 TaxID=3396624 RepID=UPI003A8C82D5
MHLIKPNLRQYYPMAFSAQGSTIMTDDNRTILDGCSGAIACSLGHGHPYIIDRMRTQAHRLSAAYRTQSLNLPAERLAQRLCSKLGQAGAFFVNSGSEAVEAACRTAIQYWDEVGRSKKRHILSRTISYHGSTQASLSLSGHWPRRRNVCSPDQRPTIPTPYCYRCPYGKSRKTCQLACAQALEIELGQIGADAVAALLIEPITGASGAAILPPAGYLETISDICKRNDVLLIADEVLTGLGRTGTWLAMDHGQVKADISVLGKGLNAGYFPLSGILVTEAIKEAIELGSGVFSYGHTHSNHPIGAAVGHAVLDVLETEGLVPLSASRGPIIESYLQRCTDSSPIIGQIRGAGMLWGVEIVQDKPRKTPFVPGAQAAESLVRLAWAKGLNLYPASGFAAHRHGDAVIFAPPLNTPMPMLEEMLLLLEQILQSAPGHLHKEADHA